MLHDLQISEKITYYTEPNKNCLEVVSSAKADTVTPTES
jgi:hypothetical protein